MENLLLRACVMVYVMSNGWEMAGKKGPKENS